MCFHVKPHIFMQMSTRNCVNNPIIDTNTAILYNFDLIKADNDYIGHVSVMIGLIGMFTS